METEALKDLRKYANVCPTSSGWNTVCPTTSVRDSVPSCGTQLTEHRTPSKKTTSEKEESVKHSTSSSTTSPSRIKSWCSLERRGAVRRAGRKEKFQSPLYSSPTWTTSRDLSPESTNLLSSMMSTSTTFQENPKSTFWTSTTAEASTADTEQLKFLQECINASPVMSSQCSFLTKLFEEEYT